MQNKNTSFDIKRWRQKGQSMVEYTVVSVFGILVLTTGPSGDMIVELTNAIRNNYDGYSYAISLSDYPDKEDIGDLIDMYEEQGMSTEQSDYLTDDIEQLVEDAKDYALDSFPALDEGLDLLDGLGLDFSDFCDICDGNPF